MTTSCARSLAPSSGVDARPAWRRPGPQTGTARPNLDKPTRPRAMLTALGGRHDATSPPDPDALHSCSRHSCGANRWNGEGTPISTRDKSTAPGCSSSHGRRDPPALDCRPPRQAATAGRVRSAQDEHQPEARKKLARRLAAQDRHHRSRPQAPPAPPGERLWLLLHAPALLDGPESTAQAIAQPDDDYHRLAARQHEIHAGRAQGAEPHDVMNVHPFS